MAAAGAAVEVAPARLAFTPEMWRTRALGYPDPPGGIEFSFCRESDRTLLCGEPRSHARGHQLCRPECQCGFSVFEHQHRISDQPVPVCPALRGSVPKLATLRFGQRHSL